MPASADLLTKKLTLDDNESDYNQGDFLLKIDLNLEYLKEYPNILVDNTVKMGLK